MPSLEERMAVAEERLRVFSKVEENIINHINLKIDPVIEDVADIKDKIYNGLSDEVAANTLFRKNHDRIYGAPAIHKKEPEPKKANWFKNLPLWQKTMTVMAIGAFLLRDEIKELVKLIAQWYIGG